MKRLLVCFVAAVAAGVVSGESTSSIILTPDEKTVCAVNQDSGTISLWKWRDGQGVTEIRVGDEPRTLAASPDGRFLYVANQRSQTLSVVDIGDGKTKSALALGGQPYGVLVNAEGTQAYVSQYAGGYLAGKYRSGTVAVVDLTLGKIIQHIPTKPRPWAMALSADGRTLYVTHYLHFYKRGVVTEIDTTALSVKREFYLLTDPNESDGSGGVFNALAGIALHPNGRRALVTGMHANVYRGHYINEQPLSHKTTVQAAIRVLDLEKGTELPDSRILSSFFGQAVAVPAAVVFLAGGEHFVDLYECSSDFKVLKYNERGIVAERTLRSVPLGPTGITITRDGGTGFVASRWDRSVSQFSMGDIRDPRLVKTLKVTREPWDAQRLRGAILFNNTRDPRMTANQWMSCTVCHLEGGLVSDALLWDLTIDGAALSKVTNTMDLVLTGDTAPPFFHRGIPRADVALERFVRKFHQGHGFWKGRPEGRAPQEWEDIAAYMNALEARPNPHRDGRLVRPEIKEAAGRGKQIFFDTRVGCSRCHCGPQFTLSGSEDTPTFYDVGTEGKLDVPSLLHLWDTGPYLHDGRARRLGDVLTYCNRFDRHGKTSHLTKQQRDDLVAFMLSAGGKIDE